MPVAFWAVLGVDFTGYFKSCPRMQGFLYSALMRNIPGRQPCFCLSLFYTASIPCLFAMVEGYLPILLQNQSFRSAQIGSLGSIWNFLGILAMFLAGRMGDFGFCCIAQGPQCSQHPHPLRRPRKRFVAGFFAFCTAKLNLLATRLLRVPV